MHQEIIDAPLAATSTQSEVGALALVTLDPAKYVTEVFQPFRSKLDALKAEADAAQFDVATTAGMATALKYRAAFRDDVRVAGEKARQQRKAPILEIGRLLDSKYKELAAEVAPYEERFDSAIKAEEKRKADEKAEKARIEAARIAAIRAKIDAILAMPAQNVSKNSADLNAALTSLAQRTASAEEFAELVGEAALAIETTAEVMIGMRDKAAEAEAAALAAEDARKAEAARLEAERAELARLRAEQDERERIANAEADRIAAEQAAEARRLVEERRQQEAELQAQRDAEAARVRAEEDARAAVVAEQQRQIAIQQEQLAEQRAAFAREQEETRARAEAAARLESDHAEALLMDEQFNVDREAERVRLQALAEQSAIDARERADDERKAHLPAGSLHHIEIEGPSDREFIELAATTFDMTFADALERVASIAFDELRAVA
jgi:hypothetical protein